MKRFALFSVVGLFTLLLVAVVGAALAPQFVDFNKYKVLASDKIKEASGFDVAFNGDVSLGIFPAPHVSLQNVAVQNPDGFSGEHLATFDALDVQVSLAPLFSGQVDVQSVRLVSPRITLETNAAGQSNWTPPKGSAAPVSDSAGSGSDASKAPKISLNTIKISDGALTYKNGKAEPVEVTAINLDIDGKSLQGPFDIEGSLSAFAQDLNFKAGVDEFSSLEEPLSLVLSGGVSPANVTFEYGGIVDVPKQAVQGQLDAAFEGGEFKGIVSADAEKVSVTDMSLAAAGYTVKGAVSSTLKPVAFKGSVSANGSDISFSGGFKDALSVVVRADAVDLDRLMRAQKGTSAEALKQPLGLPPSSSSSAGSKKSGGVPVIFDVSVNKAIFQGEAISGIKAGGVLNGNALELSKLSVDDFAGASVSGSGRAANFKALSGLDVNVSGRVSNIKTFSTFVKFDASKLPAQLSSLSYSVKAKGDMNGSLDTDVSLEALKGRFGVKGVIKAPTKKPSFDRLAISASHPNFNTLLKTLAPNVPRYDSFGAAFKLTSSLAMKDKVLSLSGLSSSIGKTSMKGDLRIDTGAGKPDVSGAVRFNDLVLRSSGAAPAGGSAKKSGGSKGGKWSKAPLNSAWLNAMNANLDIKAESLLYESWDIKNPSIKFVMKGGTLTIQDLKAGLYGGSLGLSSVLKAVNADGTGLSVAAKARFNGVDLEKLAGSLIGTRVIQAKGKVNLSTDISGQGTSQAALVSSLGGSGAVSGEALVLEGFDVAKFARSMSIDTKPGDTLSGLWGGATKGGSTAFDTLDGAYSIANGIVTLQKLALDGPSALIESKGAVNLPRWSLDTTHSMSAKGSDLPPFTIDIKGPLDNPGQTFAQGAIQNYLQKKLSRKLNKVLGDKLNLEGGDAPIEQQLINKFLSDKLGLPKASNDNAPADTQPAAGGTAQPKPAQEEFTPEKAIEGVLRGLF